MCVGGNANPFRFIFQSRILLNSFCFLSFCNCFTVSWSCLCSTNGVCSSWLHFHQISVVRICIRIQCSLCIKHAVYGVFLLVCCYMSVPNYCESLSSRCNLFSYIRKVPSAIFARRGPRSLFQWFSQSPYRQSILDAMCFVFLVILQKCPPGGVQIGLQLSDTPEAHTVRAQIFDEINLHDIQVRLSPTMIRVCAQLFVLILGPCHLCTFQPVLSLLQSFRLQMC